MTRAAILVNDKKTYNTRYRTSLMQELKVSGYAVLNIGVFDTIFSFLSVFIHC